MCSTIFLLPILLIGCSEPDRKVSSNETERNVSNLDPEWKTRELERKAKVQSLIEDLGDDSQENRQVAFVELRDKYIRRRDIAELSKEIDRNKNPNAQSLLLDLYLDILLKWRLPNNVWISNLFECATNWGKEFEYLGYEASVAYNEYGLHLTIPFKSEYSTEVINLILDMEPRTLIFEGGEDESISDNAFIATLEDPAGDIIIFGVKNGSHTDITPSSEADRDE
jgi:hypothetical protein